MKFKDGQRVRVVSDLDKCGADDIVSEMYTFQGEIVTIENYDEDAKKYRLIERSWWWEECTLEKINNELNTTTKKETPKMESKKLTQKEIAIEARRERGKKIKQIRDTFNIKKVLVNGSTVIIWFNDDTKVVEKCSKDDEFDLEIAIALGIIHSGCGSKSLFKEVVGKIIQQNTTFVEPKKGGK